MATLDLSQFETVWEESFDNGTGLLSRSWGNVDTSVAGQITLTSYVSDGYLYDSGAMVSPTSADAGFGYGLYSFTVSTDPGDAPGPYALLWPATDVWPGPELDVVEILPGGTAYSTIHWDQGGDNAFQSYMLDGVDASAVHTYAIDWEADHLTVYVDGQEMFTTTENVPKDYADGGENSAPGVGMQTWWSIDAQHGDNSITAYDVSYAAPVGEGSTTPVAPQPVDTAPPPVEDTPTETPPTDTTGTGTVHAFAAVADSPVWAAQTIDWTAGDLIDLSHIVLAGDNAPEALHWAGVDPDGADKAWGVWEWSDGSGMLRADATGDGLADFSIILSGAPVITASDLVLA
jgi:beta-glucanase (GH16 family)